MKDPERYRKAEELELPEIKDYFSSNGYQVESLGQAWRHVTGVLKKKGERYFLKLASTEGIAERTRNEYGWNSLINSLPKEQSLPVSVPKNHDSGEFNGLFWYLSEYVDGPLLAEPEKREETQSLEENLDIIAETAAKIIDIDTDKKLPHDVETTMEERKEAFFARLSYYEEESGRDLCDLIEFMKERFNYLKIAPSHGDFVPWHFIKSEEREGLYLVDGEHAHILGVKFYDVAYFYHRLYTKLKRPDLSGRFLAGFKDIYQMNKEDEELFRFILAQRVVGGYFDASRDSIISVNLQDELTERILQEKSLLPTSVS